jgi:hypothetical protein
MSAQLVMAGPGQPMVHNALHDLESFFYVLVGVCVLYDGPSMQKSEADLAECFDKFFSTFELSVLKTITVQSELTWTSFIVKYIHPYFKPLVPLLSYLRAEIILPLATDECGDFYHKNLCNHDTFIRHIIMALSELQPEHWNDASLKQKSSDSSCPASLEIPTMQSESGPPSLPLLLAPPAVLKNFPPGRGTIQSDSGLHQPIERAVRQVQESDSDEFMASSPLKVPDWTLTNPLPILASTPTEWPTALARYPRGIQ